MRFLTGWSLRPSWIGTLAVAVLLPTFTSLGFWQLRRAEDKTALFEQFESSLQGQVVAGLPQDDPPRYARVEVIGHFIPDMQFLLDNMTHSGRSGYHVLTPFVSQDEERWLVVNRGWLPAGRDRQSLPEVSVSSVATRITGRLDNLPRPGIELSSGSTGVSRWPQVVFFPDMAALEELVGHRLYGFQLLLDPQQPEGYLRDWQPRSLAPEQHLGYAVQWFAFSVLLLILYVALGLKRQRP